MKGIDSTGDRSGGGAALVALVAGLSAALPLYLWHSSLQAAVAAFLIVGYTGWLWVSTRCEIAMVEARRADLRTLPINVWYRRAGRLIVDPAFWWSLLFGCTMVGGSLWYVGLHDIGVVAMLAGAWGCIAVCLNYGLSLLHPTTICRRCGYQLIAQMHGRTGSRIRCPECGVRWTPAELGHAEPPNDAGGQHKRAA